METPKIAQSHPMTRVLGSTDMNAAVAESVTAILKGELALQTGLQQLNARLNEILQRTETP